MKTHELKCWPQYFDAVWDNKKKFEIRINDRDFKVGDILILKKFDPEKEEYLPQSIETTISYVLDGPSFGLAKGFAIISFDQIKCIMSKQSATEIIKLPYSWVLIPQENGGFSASITEFPGCIAEGETPEETWHNLSNAAITWIEICLEKGEKVPDPITNYKPKLKIANDLPTPKPLTKEDIERIREEGAAFGKELGERAKAMQLTAEDWRTVVK